MSFINNDDQYNLKSARLNTSVKDKFSLFMKRNSHTKRSSDFSNDGSALSGDNDVLFTCRDIGGNKNQNRNSIFEEFKTKRNSTNSGVRYSINSVSIYIYVIYIERKAEIFKK